MWSFIWPIALVVLANTVYNITTKSTPENANAFLSLAVTYLVGGAVCLLIFVFSGHKNLFEELHKLNWTAYVLGLVIVGLEVGYIYIYRAGWTVNTAPLVANITLSCVLLFVGFFLFKEEITVKKVLGLLVCFGGLFLLNQK